MVCALSDSTANTSVPFCVSAANGRLANATHRSANAHGPSRAEMPIDSLPDVCQFLDVSASTEEYFRPHKPLSTKGERP